MFELETFSQLMPAIDILAVAVFAVSGALVASRKGLDLLGFMWFAVLTGVGGGTVRDVILGVPVFWLDSPAHISACLITAVIVHFTAHLVESRYQVLLWFDALGLALFTVAGTAKGLDHDTGALIAIVMGVITGSVGGIIRDVVGGQRSVILRREVYMTASALGAGCYALMMALSVAPTAAAIIGFLVTFVIRGLAIRFNLCLPVWHRRLTTTHQTDDSDCT